MYLAPAMDGAVEAHRHASVVAISLFRAVISVNVLVSHDQKSISSLSLPPYSIHADLEL